MRINENALLEDQVSIQSCILGTTVLVPKWQKSEGVATVFAQEKVAVKQLALAAVLEVKLTITGGTAPWDLGFTPEATELKIYRSGVKSDAPLIRLKARAERDGVDLEVAAASLENEHTALHKQLASYDRRAEELICKIDSLLPISHRSLEYLWLRVVRHKHRGSAS